VEWRDEYAPDCETCKKMHDRLHPGEPLPCGKCQAKELSDFYKIDLLEENQIPAEIYMMVRGQVITRFNGEYGQVMDLNHLAVWAAIDAYEIKARLETFHMIRRVFFHFLGKEKQ
jgi:hypothetical protein